LICNLHTIYGKDFAKKIPELLVQFGEKGKPLAELYQMIILTTMRQQGKTTGIQSSMAAIVLELMRFKGVCFAPTKRQSVAVSRGIIDFIRKVPGGQERIVRNNQEDLYVTPFPAGEPSLKNDNNSIVRCLPASERGDVFVCAFVNHLSPRHNHCER
jgi:hypothetical protein